MDKSDLPACPLRGFLRRRYPHPVPSTSLNLHLHRSPYRLRGGDRGQPIGMASTLPLPARCPL